MSTKKMFSAAYLALVVGFAVGLLLCRSCVARDANDTPVQPDPADFHEFTPTQPLPPKEPPQPEEPICRERVYIVPEKGPINSLWRIAEQELGSGYLYPYLAIASDIENPDLIHPGQAIVIPCLTPEELERIPVIHRPARPAVDTKEALVKPAEVVVETEPAEAVVEVEKEEQVIAPVEPEPKPVVETPEEEPPIPDQPTPEIQEELEEREENRDDLPPLARDFVLRKMVTVPGSMWNSLGTTPIESGNSVNYFHINQGLIVAGLPGRLQIGPYAALNFSKDTRNYLWNNRTKGEAGIKISRPFARGVVEASASYALESRRGDGGTTKTGFIWSSGGWFGWHQPTRLSSAGPFSSLPGSAQWIVGNISPFEEGNLIGMARFEQGFMLTKVKGVSFVPIMWWQVGTDSAGEPWNNRYIQGLGLKTAIPWNTGTVNLVAGYECAGVHRDVVVNSDSTCGPTARIDFWTGWNRRGGF